MENKVDNNQKRGVQTVAPHIKLEKEYLETLLPDEQEIYQKIKGILIDKCELYEFEVCNDDTFEDINEMMNFIKNDIITFKESGVNVKLRKKLQIGESETDNLTISFDRNEGKEKSFTKGIKVSKKDIESQKAYSRALLAASIKNVTDSMNKSLMIGVQHTYKLSKRDYDLLMSVYSFFRG